MIIAIHYRKSELSTVEIGYNGGTIFLGNDREASVFNLRQKTFEVTDNFTFYKGINTFTVGTHNEFYGIDYGFVNSPNGRISYRSLAEFQAKITQPCSGSLCFQQCSENLDYQFNNPYAHFNVNLLSVYAQDEIQISDRVKLSPGIRLDYTGLPTKPTLNSQVTSSAGDRSYGTTYSYTPLRQITNKYLDNVQISPRLGFTVDVKGDKSVVVRGGTGLFTGRIPFAWLGYAFYNDGVGYGAYDYNNNATATTKLAGDPLNQTTGGANGVNANPANGGVRRTQVDLIDK